MGKRGPKRTRTATAEDSGLSDDSFGPGAQVALSVVLQLVLSAMVDAQRLVTTAITKPFEMLYSTVTAAGKLLWFRKNQSNFAEDLMQPDSLEEELTALRHQCPGACDLLDKLCTGPWMQRQSRQKKNQKAKQRAEQSRLRTLHDMLTRVVKSHSNRGMSMFQVKRSMYYYMKGTPYAVYDDLARDGVVIPRAALRDMLKDLKDYIPQTKHKKHSKYVVVALDNLDIYRRIGLQRTKGGDTLTSQLLHFVVSVQCYFDAEILDGCEMFDEAQFQGLHNVADGVSLTKPAANGFLRKAWDYMLGACDTTPATEILLPPHKSKDKHPAAGRTVCRDLPIESNCSTAAYDDMARAYSTVEALFPGCIIVLVGDYQTFNIMYFLKKRSPDVYKRMMPFGGELHRQFHGLDAIFRLDWDYWIEPFALLLHRTDIKEKHRAEENNRSDLFTRIVTIGCFRWMKKILKHPTAPQDPEAFMESVKGNVVAWDFVGFLYYRLGWYTQGRYATRVGDIDQLDQNWRYMGLLAHSTGKTNYARYALKMERVLHDTDATLRRLFSSAARLYRETDYSCTHRGADTACERVRFSAPYIYSSEHSRTTLNAF
jgi:hypothetical protein